MWIKLSSIIIKNRLWLVIFTAIVTVFMAYIGKDVEMTYDFIKVVPADDPDLIYFEKFKKKFGEDGNIMVIGMEDKSVFTLKKFQDFQKLSNNISKVEGVNEVISLPNMKRLSKDPVEKKFVLSPMFTGPVHNQSELDSLLSNAKDNKFYEGLLLNENTKATLIAVAIEKSYLNSARRTEVVNEIFKYCDDFSDKNNIKLHYAGLPYVRAIMISKVQGEFKLFVMLAIAITSLILFFFFRSFSAVFFTFLVIVVTVCWTMGTMVLLGYKMTLLTGVLPALIIVISIPNCIYMFNKYHQEFKRHGNKIKAVSKIIEKIGFLTFMTNANTAVGFFVLYFTNVLIIKEFGMVAGIISLATFFITMVVIPPMLLFLPAPNKKQLRHLDLNMLRKVNFFLERIVLNYKKTIYTITIVILAISFYGMSRIEAVSYMVDDLPEKSNVKTDLAFFERNFKGIMPLEIIVDMGKKKSIMKLSNLEKLEEFESFLKGLDNVSPPLSILNILKGSTQAYYNGNVDFYKLPSNRDKLFILQYFGKGSQNAGLIKSFVDSTGQIVRFTCKVADIGTNRMNELVKKVIEPKAKEIFADTDFKVKLTGTTLIFLKGNEYLINDLSGSLFFAFILISLMMAMIFANVRMVVISLIPNLIPMIITAGIMGLFHIPLKPSTALIFSISFGISIDSTIHYLSKYKQELRITQGDIVLSVKRALEEGGVSMIYTSIVLFCGFIIFSFSDFGGTIALGVLTSITLFFAMFTNLTLLPALLLSFAKHKKADILKRSASDNDSDEDHHHTHVEEKKEITKD